MSETPSGNILRVAKDAETLRARTVETLRNAILTLHFKPGQRLVERELCEQTGVSRTSVREALRHLESEGLIDTVPNKGPIVALVSKDEAKQIYEVRTSLEALICALFTDRASDAEVKALDRSVNKLEKAIERKDFIGAQQAKEDFFNILYQGCGNAVACAVSRTLRARVNFLAAEGTKRWDPETVTRRRKVVDAIRKRNAQQASEAFIRHMKVAQDLSDDLLEKVAILQA